MGEGLRRTPEQIIRKLRQAEVLSSQGMSVEKICRELGVSDATYYKWRRQYGGMGIDQARRLKELEAENARLKRVVADLSLDKQILKDAAFFTHLWGEESYIALHPMDGCKVETSKR